MIKDSRIRGFVGKNYNAKLRIQNSEIFQKNNPSLLPSLLFIAEL